METRTLPILKAVNNALNAIRRSHPEIPELVVVLGSSGRTKKGQTHGHFAPKSWAVKDGQTRIHEMFLSGESLQRGGKATLGTIIHECVHAYCHEQGISDTSNAGRYHNKSFKSVAESFGLEISSAPVIGWSVTEVPEVTAQKYAAYIEDLDAAITTHRDSLVVAASTSSGKKFYMQCPDCQDKVTVTKKWFERNEFNLYCIRHDQPFEFIEEEPE